MTAGFALFHDLEYSGVIILISLIVQIFVRNSLSIVNKYNKDIKLKMSIYYSTENNKKRTI